MKRLFFCLLILVFGVQMVISQYNFGQQTAAMQWPEWIYGCFVPFGAIFMTIRFAQITLEEIRSPEDKLKTDAELMIEEAAAEEAAYLAREDEKK